MLSIRAKASRFISIKLENVSILNILICRKKISLCVARDEAWRKSQ